MSEVCAYNPGLMRKALVVSIGLHLIACLPLPYSPNRVSMHPPLFARLQPARLAVPSVDSATPVVEPAPLKTLTTQNTVPRARPAPEVHKDSGAASSHQAASVRPNESPVTQPASSALEVNEGEIDGGALRTYVLNVAVAVTRVVAAAPRDTGKIGRVKLRVSIGPGARGVDVLVSSGESALDEDARALVARALSAASMPDALKGRVVSFEVPVSFGGERRSGF